MKHENNKFGQPQIMQAADMQMSHDLFRRWFAEPGDIPISFLLDGEVINGIPEGWNPTANRRLIDANITETTFDGTDIKTGLNLRIEFTQYRDYPVIEWVAWLTNTSEEPTPVISDILALNGAIDGASPVVHHWNGDFYHEEGYTPSQSPLRPGDKLDFAPEGGRSCDRAFPYYRVKFDNWGLSLAIGWPAQWAASFTCEAGGLRLRAGQGKTNLRLMPGERIRTPRITMLCWFGDDSRAVNLWRRWYLAHILPRPNGQPMRPLLGCSGTDDGEEFTEATEGNQIACISRFGTHDIHPDVWWIDAGWYTCRDAEGNRRWWHTGEWTPDPDRFPNGLKPVSDWAAESGADLLLWFEPERVQPGTQIDVQRPEWLLKAQGDDNRLLNLGNPECRQWLTDHFCSLIQDNGVKIYRQDHNFAPLQHWRENEPEDRQGINENLHVQGYLQFWDDLLARNPGLWIDSCASGGRRNDLETMRRSVPLHYTDFGYGNHPIKLAFHRTLFEWIPYFKESTLSWDKAEMPTDFSAVDRFDRAVDSYSYHCSFAAMLYASLDIRREDYDYALAGKMIAVWRRAADMLLYGDYYPHTPFHRSVEKWVVWQFDSHERGEGFIQAIRLPLAPEDTITIRPKALCEDALYVFENGETGEAIELTGKTLIRDGFKITCPSRNAAIWFYRTKHE